MDVVLADQFSQAQVRPVDAAFAPLDGLKNDALLLGGVLVVVFEQMAVKAVAIQIFGKPFVGLEPGDGLGGIYGV